jgi:hypothetical protein
MLYYSYGSIEEELERFNIFRDNLEWINKKNSENLGFTVAMNHVQTNTSPQ